MPSAVEGLEGVREVVVTSEWLELRVGDHWLRREFTAFRRERPPVFRGYIGERDRFQPRPYFRFYSDPPLTIYMPEESADATFAAVRSTIHAGAYRTFDLG